MVRFVVLDVDGVLTDGRIYMGPSGESHKAFDVKDGAGIVDWLADRELAIVTGRESEIVTRRCEELGIETVRQGVSDKQAVVEQLASDRSIPLEETAYVGDDATDTAVMEVVGVAGAPADAAQPAKAAADIVLENAGGRGAVREFLSVLQRDAGTVLGVIPARYGSTRFPGKPLAEIAGKPMIQHVFENASSATELDELVVATDDTRISETVEAFGGTAVMTSSDHTSGTSRVAAVAADYDATTVVNIQGDEPLIEPDAIDATIRGLTQSVARMCTPIARMRDTDELDDPNTVKVVTDANDHALYFSRSRIPSQSDLTDTYKHIGLYAFECDLLLKYVDMDSRLHEDEDLEQLRLLENGYTIQTVEVSYEPKEVNVEADIEKVEQALTE